MINKTEIVNKQLRNLKKPARQAETPKVETPKVETPKKKTGKKKSASKAETLTAVDKTEIVKEQIKVQPASKEETTKATKKPTKRDKKQTEKDTITFISTEKPEFAMNLRDVNNKSAAGRKKNDEIEAFLSLHNEKQIEISKDLLPRQSLKEAIQSKLDAYIECFQCSKLKYWKIKH